MAKTTAPHGLAKRHDLSRNLIRLWVRTHEAGAFDEDADAADRMQEDKARIAAFERLVGRQTLELEFLKGLFEAHRAPGCEPSSATPSAARSTPG